MLTRNAIKITIEGLLCLARSDALLLSAASSSATALTSINTQTPPSYNLLQALNARGVNLIDFCFSILLKCLQTISEHVADHQISLLPLLRCAAELSVMAHRWYALFTLYLYTNYTFSYIVSTSSPTLVPRSAKEKSVPSLLDVVKDSSSSEPSSTSPQTHIALLRTALLELISKASSAQLPHVVTEAILALIWSAPPIFDATTRGSKGNTSAVAAPSPLTSTSDVFASAALRTSISGSLSTAPPGSDNRYVE